MFDGQRLHMMGIGGAGVSGLALLCRSLGADVSGCDPSESEYSRRVAAAGIEVSAGHAAGHVCPGDSALVVSSAVPPDHVEIARARELGVPVLLRGELLGRITAAMPSIVVAGAHGKSTTTAMVWHAARRAALDWSLLVGATLAEAGGNVHVGTQDWLVCEGDESDRTLRFLTPRVAVITNIEHDHHHTFATLDEVVELFGTWVEGFPPATVLVAGPGADVDRVVARATCEVRRFGRPGDELPAGDLHLAIPGEHNLLNAQAALMALAAATGASALPDPALLDGFSGVGRRFELVGAGGGVTVIDDYAHHPTEVEATIRAARQRFAHVAVVFQPHLYSRTLELGSRFAAALAEADDVVVLPIYRSREPQRDDVDATAITRHAPAGAQLATSAFPQHGQLTPQLQRLLAGAAAGSGCVITMGAGDVTTLAPLLLDSLRTGSATGTR